eukprot:m.128698 g.128698  ORF g.128698 m.128698 type:complete len:110 (-) comp9454_c0_seq1:4161-4490(-)
MLVLFSFAPFRNIYNSLTTADVRRFVLLPFNVAESSLSDKTGEFRDCTRTDPAVVNVFMVEDGGGGGGGVLRSLAKLSSGPSVDDSEINTGDGERAGCVLRVDPFCVLR